MLTTNANEMANDNLILKNWLEQELVFLQNLKICRKRPTIDAIHDIRVAVKKMRSYLRLKDLFIDEAWKDEFSKIAALFKSTGRLRDLDKSLHVIRNYEHKESITYNFLKEYLVKTRGLIRNWIKKETRVFDLQTGVLVQQLRSLDVVDSEIIEKIVAVTAQKIKKLKNLGKHVKKNAHEMRKELKDVFYWIKICPEDLIGKSITIKALDKFIDELGHWQDHFVLRRKLKFYCKEVALREEKEQLKDLDKKLANGQDDILQKAKEKLQEIEIKKATVLSQSPF
jgi:CHAD domain-containing protein